MFTTLWRTGTRPCTSLPQGSRLGDFAQPGKSARLVVPGVADREDGRQWRCPVRTQKERPVPVPSLTASVADPEGGTQVPARR